MKKNNGFTLIELLAVIIILAVIALIATPIVLNVVDNAKKSAAGSSVQGYIDAIQLARYEYMFANNGAEPDDAWLQGQKTTVSVKGERPVDCTLSMTNGVITATGCKVKSYSETKTVSINEQGKVTWSDEPNA